MCLSSTHLFCTNHRPFAYQSFRQQCLWHSGSIDSLQQRIVTYPYAHTYIYIQSLSYLNSCQLSMLLLTNSSSGDKWLQRKSRCLTGKQSPVCLHLKKISTWSTLINYSKTKPKWKRNYSRYRTSEKGVQCHNNFLCYLVVQVAFEEGETVFISK